MFGWDILLERKITTSFDTKWMKKQEQLPNIKEKFHRQIKLNHLKIPESEFIPRALTIVWFLLEESKY